jgi:hypothetical protein
MVRIIQTVIWSLFCFLFSVYFIWFLFENFQFGFHINNLAVIWSFFCFFYFLYVLFGFPLKFFNLAFIEIIWLFFCFLFNILYYLYNFFLSFDLDPIVMTLDLLAVRSGTVNARDWYRWSPASCQPAAAPYNRRMYACRFIPLVW